MSFSASSSVGGSARGGEPLPGGLRVVVVVGDLELGGTERQVVSLAGHLLHHEGCRVEVWSLTGEGLAARLLERAGVPWRVVPFTWLTSWRIPRGLAAFALALRRARPDVVLAYTSTPNVLCGLTWKLSRARTCVWNQRDEGRDLAGRPLERLAVRWAPAFLSNSRHGAEFLERTLGVQTGRIAVIPNGIALAEPVRDREHWRRSLGAGRDRIVACMIGNLHPFKDHLTLLDAWGILARAAAAEDVPILCLAGQGPLRTSLVERVAAHGLQGCVRFLDQVEDVSGLLHSVDLAVHSSRYEGVPNAVLEAMAAGLPVIATDIPGIREAVGTGCGADLVPPGDPVALADRLDALVRDPERRAGYGAANRVRIREAFGLPRMLADTTAFIADALRRAMA